MNIHLNPIILSPLDGIINLNEKTSKVIFLAGPIQGAENWQQKVCDYLSFYFKDVKTSEQIYIANPRRVLAFEKTDIEASEFSSQVKWESFYLRLASKTGTILFWIPNQTEEHPDSYAKTTRFELGEWFGQIKYFSNGIDMQLMNSNIVVGIEPNFPGRKYIQERLNDFNMKLWTTVEESISKVLEIIYPN